MNSSQTLSSKMIDSGEKLIQYLDDHNFIVRAALWVNDSEFSNWRLVIASPEFRTFGPKKAYKRLLSQITKSNLTDFDLNQITIIDSNDSSIELLKSAVQTGSGISGMFFNQNTINGIRFPDSYIYRVN